MNFMKDFFKIYGFDLYMLWMLMITVVVMTTCIFSQRIDIQLLGHSMPVVSFLLKYSSMIFFVYWLSFFRFLAYVGKHN